MKTLVVLSALVVAAAAGSALSEDVTDFEVTKSMKRSPTFGKHHTVGIPVPVPVHQTYVQPVIPHHLGLKKPLLFHNHGHHLYREDEEQAEARSVEPKEIKNKCMKEMEAKCDDELIAKSSELDGTKIEDVDENISESEVVQSLQMAKEAVDTLQKKLQKAEKNSRMSQWKHGESESDLKLHENIATAKQALDHMQLNFGNLESMKVHATTFKDSGVQDVHLELGKSEQERLSQWKDAIENIQKNVELVKNIEDSFQSTEMRSASFEKSSNLKQANIGDHESSAGNIKLKEENDSNVKRASEMEVAEKVTEKSDMESSASTLSEMKITHHSLNDHHGPSSRSDSSSSQPQSKHEMSYNSNTAIEPLGVFPVTNGKKMTLQGLQTDGDSEQSKNINDKLSNAKQMELALPLTKTIKSSEIEDTKLSHLDQGKSAPIVDTTALMKSADQHNNSQLNIDSNKDESDLKNTEATEPKFQMEHSRSSQLDSSMIMDQKSTDMSSSSIHNDNAHHMLMKSSDQMTGQSQHSEVVAKATQLQHSQHLEKSSHLNALGAHGKSAEGDSFSSQTSLTGLNAGFKSSLDVPKTMALKDASWKDGVSRSSYGSGAALGGGYGVGGGIGGGYGGGIGGGVGGGVGGAYGGGGAVGVFPSARVGGCAIPLLLSCSPSVVAGSLAKAHSSYAAPSYAAPAYRSTDTTNTHTKRDITKIATPTKIKRTSNKNLKSNPILITDRL